MSITCKQCGAAVGTVDLTAGRCSKCGCRLDAGEKTVDLPIGATIDLPHGISPDEPPPKPPTVPDVAIYQTVDFATVDPAAAPAAPSNEPKTPTIHDGEGLMTVDLPAGGVGAMAGAGSKGEPKLPTQLESQLLATFDSAAFGASVPSAKPAGMAGGDSMGFSLAASMADVWGEEADESRPSGSAPGAERRTIKGREKGKPGNDQTLVVNARSFADAKKLPPGTKLGADYELLDLLGEGGMGVVYTARQASIDRTVAVKMLKPNLAANRDLQLKFLSEAVVTGDLDHPNIVPMYDLGKNDAGALFYAMKRVEGTPWSKALNRKTQQENLEILLKVADAVAFAHARGVVHRDLKPENVMLGDFGEVLVMDWGLAYSTPQFRKSESVTHSHSMGGSPAYMAPEMATGPIERITAASDIYLLGAILYEIVAGHPPHGGGNVTKCLMAAARNEIRPTEKTGELIDVAMRAMATDPAARYPTVQAFQAAIRSHLAHNESIVLAERAERELAEARTSRDYREFARAVFGFEESLELWTENDRASVGLQAARAAYAAAALDKGDYDLGLSLLDVTRPEFAPLVEKLNAGRRERDARQSRLKRARQLAVALVAAIFIGGTAAYFVIRDQRDRAVVAETQATQDRDRAVVAERQAHQDRDRAVTAEGQTRQERDRAVTAETTAKLERDRAVTAETAAKQDRDRAVAAEGVAKQERDRAEEAKAAEEYAAYLARIGLAAARIDENAFDSASQLLDTCPPQYRNWEWGRLKYLCGRSKLSIDVGAPVGGLAIDAEGRRCATGDWSGAIGVYNVADGARLAKLKYGGTYVHAVAFSPDGKFTAVGGSDPQAYAQVWNLATGAATVTFQGHTAPVSSIVYDRAGRRVLTASADGTARLWDASTGEELCAVRGHSSPVYSAVFSTDESQFITAGQDGSVLVWSTAAAIERRRRGDVDDGEVRAFMEHKSPVRAAAFASSGSLVASAADDGRVLLWNPAEVQPYRLAEVFGQAPSKPVKFQTLAEAGSPLTSLAYSRDGRRLAAGGRDNVIRVWNTADGTLLKTLRGHAGSIRAVAFLPDSRQLLSAAHDGQVKLWDVDAYVETQAVPPQVLAGHADAVLGADVAADGETVITAGRDRTAKLWNARTAAELKTLEEGHSFLTSSVATLADGKRMVTSAADGTTRIWNLETGAELRSHLETGRGAAPVESQDGAWLLTGGPNRGAQLWNLADGKPVQAFAPHRTEPTALAISPDGKQILTGEKSGRTNLWDVATGKLVWTVHHHSRKVTAAVFVDEGRAVLTASLDNSVARLNAADGTETVAGVLKHPLGVTSLAIVDADRVATACEDGRVRLWQWRAATATDVKLGPGAFTHVAASADASRLLAVDPNQNIVRLYDLSAGREIGAAGAADDSTAPWLAADAAGGLVWSAGFTRDGKHVVLVGGEDARLVDLTGKQDMAFRPHGAVAGVAFAPDGKLAATAGWDGAVKLWSVPDGRSVRRIEGGHTGGVGDVAFSPDGKLLLTAGDDRTARMWNVADGAEIRVLKGHADRVLHAEFSHDGKRIVTASADKTARVWNAADGRLLRTLTGHEWQVMWAEFSSDGKRVVTASADNAARVFDISDLDVGANAGDAAKPADAKPAAPLVLQGHTAAVNCAAFSPDGKRVVTGGRDGGVKLWDASNGKEVLALKGHRGDVTTVRFTRDGRRLLTAGFDGTAILWPALDWREAKPENVATTR